MRIRTRSTLDKPMPIWIFSLVATGLVPVLYLLFRDSDVLTEIVPAMLAGVLSTIFFVTKAHAENARFMKELFESFNSKYAVLNGVLYKYARNCDKEIDEEDIDKLQDYFNLCAEEWVFYKLGYIYDPIWAAWHKGMKEYSKNKHVAKMWKAEIATGSYYEFVFPEPDRLTPTDSTTTP